MKTTTLRAALGSALLLTCAQPSSAELHGHRLAHSQYGKRHAHSHRHTHEVEDQDVNATKLTKRAVCKLPNDPDIVNVPGAMNGGWAIAPDRECLAGSYCPVACVPGKVMNQWRPGTKYVVGESMDGGLFCDSTGSAVKPFSSQPICVDGTGTVSAVNKCGKGISFCQTILPGDEAMVSPTFVTGSSVLAVPGPNYWDGTSAHFYVNPPGVEPGQGCAWGKPDNPWGNWSPYVAGANTDAKGQTFVKLGWNPKFQETPSLTANMPTFGLKIECPSANCIGLPCEIKPNPNFSVTSNLAGTGAGNSDFCVVTVPKGGSANIVAYNLDGSAGAAPSPSPSPEAPKPTPTPSSSSSASSSSALSSSSKPSSRPVTVPGGLFHENNNVGNSTQSTKPSAGTATQAPTDQTTATTSAPPINSAKNDGINPDQGGAAMAGLIVALVAGLWLY